MLDNLRLLGMVVFVAFLIQLPWLIRDLSPLVTGNYPPMLLIQTTEGETLYLDDVIRIWKESGLNLKETGLSGGVRDGKVILGTSKPYNFRVPDGLVIENLEGTQRWVAGEQTPPLREFVIRKAP